MWTKHVNFVILNVKHVQTLMIVLRVQHQIIEHGQEHNVFVILDIFKIMFQLVLLVCQIVLIVIMD